MTFSDQPAKGWPNHYADAFGGMALTYRTGARGTGYGPNKHQTRAMDSWDLMKQEKEQVFAEEYLDEYADDTY